MRNHLGRTLLPLALALATTLAAAEPPTTLPAGGGQDLPSISVGQRRRAGAGASSPIFGLGPSGETGFFKPDKPVPNLSAYGNMEGELLASRMLEQLGFRTPRSRLVQVQPRYWDGSFRERVYLQAEVVGQHQPVLELGSMLPGELRQVDTAQIRRLALVDAVIGNGDRHRGNILFQQVEGGRFEPIAIDHNFAFAGKEVVPGSYWQRNFLPGMRGVELPAGVVHDANATRGAHQAGSLELILQRNHLYQEITFGALVDPVQREAMIQEARKLQGQITDGMIEAEVARLTDAEIGSKDPAARRLELIEVMKSRRDALASELRRYFDESWKSIQKNRIAISPLPEVVPPEVWKRLPLSDGARARLAYELCRPNMPPGDVYRALRLEGLDPLKAKEVAFTALRNRGVQFNPQFPHHVEAELVKSGELERDARRRPTTRENAALAGRAPGDAPFEAKLEATGTRYLDARGGTLPPEYAAAAKPVVEALQASGQVAPGDRVQVRRQGFVEGNSGAIYQAQVIDAGGQVKGTAVVRLPLGGEAVAEFTPVQRRGPAGRTTHGPGTNARVDHATMREIYTRLRYKAAGLMAQGQEAAANELVQAAREVRRMMESGEAVSRVELTRAPELSRPIRSVLGPEGTLPEPRARFKPNPSRTRVRRPRGRS